MNLDTTIRFAIINYGDIAVFAYEEPRTNSLVFVASQRIGDRRYAVEVAVEDLDLVNLSIARAGAAAQAAATLAAGLQIDMDRYRVPAGSRPYRFSFAPGVIFLPNVEVFRKAVSEDER